MFTWTREEAFKKYQYLVDLLYRDVHIPSPQGTQVAFHRHLPQVPTAEHGGQANDGRVPAPVIPVPVGHNTVINYPLMGPITNQAQKLNTPRRQKDFKAAMDRRDRW